MEQLGLKVGGGEKCEGGEGQGRWKVQDGGEGGEECEEGTQMF